MRCAHPHLLCDEPRADMSRQRLVELALMLGCDYTEGIRGVGVITALEILADFPGAAGLDDLRHVPPPATSCAHRHRDWLSSLDSTLHRAEGESRVRRHLRALNTPLVVPGGFPDAHVRAAFLSPEVDKSATPFAWGAPDYDGLQLFLARTVGWDPMRTDAFLRPLRDRARPAAQRKITQFTAAQPRPLQPGKRSRMDDALSRVALHDQHGTAPPEPAPAPTTAFSLWFHSVKEASRCSHCCET